MQEPEEGDKAEIDISAEELAGQMNEEDLEKLLKEKGLIIIEGSNTVGKEE
jgi:hypothetical protein